MGLSDQAQGQDVLAGRGARRSPQELHDELAKFCPDIEDFDVILITLDMVRPKDLAAFSADGRSENSTPHLDAFAKKSQLFRRAYATSPHRITALHSLHHSQYPSVLRALATTGNVSPAASQFVDRGRRSWAFFSKSLLEVEAEGLPTQPKYLGQSRKWWEFGAAGVKMLKIANRIEETRQKGEALFGWVHLGYPYPPARFHPGHKAEASAQGHYRAAISYCDEIIGDLMTLVAEQGNSKRTIVAIAGVHGWSSWPSGRLFRQDQVGDAELHIPLMLYVPGLAAASHDSVVESIDLLPTLLDLIAEEPEPTVQGRSMLPLLLGKKDQWPNTAFAESLPFAADVVPTIKRTLRTARDVIIRSCEERSANPTPLEAALEQVHIMNVAAARLWSLDPKLELRLDADAMDVARANWLDAQRDPRALALGRQLASKTDIPSLLAALRILARDGDASDSATLHALLDHGNSQVRALAGAALARIEQSETGLDHARLGLKPDIDEFSMSALFRALGLSKMQGALKAIADLSTADYSISLQAERILALARLGDKDSVDELKRCLLLPKAPYRRLAFVRTLVDLEGDRAVGILKLMLLHAEADRDAALYALDSLRGFAAINAEEGVAEALAHRSAAVRARAAALLLSWGSQAGYFRRLANANRSSHELTAAARGFLLYSEIIGSPALPGIRFAQPRDTKSAPRIGGRAFTFGLRRERAVASQLVFVFQAQGPNQTLTSADLSAQILLNDGARLTNYHLDKAHGLFVLSAPFDGDNLAPGDLRVSVRIRSASDKGLKASLLACLLVPKVAPVSPEIALSSLVPSTDVNEIQGRLEWEQREHRVWYSFESAPTKSGQWVIEVLRGKGSVLRKYDVPIGARQGIFRIPMERKPWPGEEYRLRVKCLSETQPLPPYQVLLFGNDPRGS